MRILYLADIRFPLERANEALLGSLFDVAPSEPYAATILRARRGRGVDADPRPLLAQGVANYQHRLFQRQRFFNKVKSAELGRADGSLDISVTGDHNHSGIRAGASHLLQGFQPINSGQPHVEQDATVNSFLERLQTLLPVRDGFHDEALVFHHAA